jgi:hypothetical protein
MLLTHTWPQSFKTSVKFYLFAAPSIVIRPFRVCGKCSGTVGPNKFLLNTEKYRVCCNGIFPRAKVLSGLMHIADTLYGTILYGKVSHQSSDIDKHSHTLLSF